MNSFLKVVIRRPNFSNQYSITKYNCASSSSTLIFGRNTSSRRQALSGCAIPVISPYHYRYNLKSFNNIASHLAVNRANFNSFKPGLGLVRRDGSNFLFKCHCYSTFLSSPTPTLSIAGNRKTRELFNRKILKVGVETGGVEDGVRLQSSMAPTGSTLALEAVKAKMEGYITEHKVMMFSKSWCPFCTKVRTLFQDLKIKIQELELDKMDTDEAALWQEALTVKTGQKTVPNVFINGEHIGGCDDTFKAYQEEKLKPLIEENKASGAGAMMGVGENHNFTYDLIVIGGGSGGLAAAKAAGKMGMRVALCDFVQPTPVGTTWGLGGTCVNVGCIPKKLMHQAALLGQAMSDAPSYGWNVAAVPTHEWANLVESVQMYIKSLNWGYRVALKDANVTYCNEYASFVDQHTIETVNKKGKKQNLTANNFLIAVGGRPRYPEIPGALEFGVTSDDIFQLPHHPGKVLCIGASYIALECAGFLAGLGIETSVMVRSILLRGFDQQIANMLGDHMEEHGVKFYRGWVPTEIVRVEEGTPPKLLVRAKETEGGETLEIEVNTVLLAIGRDPCTQTLNLNSAGVELSKSGKIITNYADRCSASNIFAIGDVAEGRPELTPVAIHAGNLLAKRLAKGSTILTDYDKVPTTVFTPLEYGCVGLSEEAAQKKYGVDDIEVYHTNFQPLEATLPKRDENKSYCKLVCAKSQNERVVGFHYVGPNAGEVTQGFALAVKMGATKTDFDSTIGIHPTTAETFTTMNITKSSGKSALKSGC